MLKIGITGGIGVGKTYVANIIENMGFPVFYSDKVSKNLLNTNQNLITLIKENFGEEIYQSDNLINTKKLSLLAFNDNEVLKKLNKIIHPFVFESFNNWCKNQTSKFVFKEAAILFESKSNKDLDKVICVSADIEIRIKRIERRDGRTSNEIRKIISNQMSQSKKEKLSDYIIENDGNKSVLFQISEILKKLE